MKQQILVIDSSVAIKWLHQENEDDIDLVDRIMKKAQNNLIELVMPELSKYEISNALLYKKLELPILLRLCERFYTLPLKFIPEDLSVAEMTMEIAYQNNMTYYDASFIALAKKMSGSLVTANQKHQKKKIKGIKILALKDYW